MPTYQLFVDDDRYEVPALVLCEASSDGHAQARAKEVLLQSPHHHRVEVFTGAKFLVTVRRPMRASSPHLHDDGPRVA
jgi:hypothetical protein